MRDVEGGEGSMDGVVQVALPEIMLPSHGF